MSFSLASVIGALIGGAIGIASAIVILTALEARLRALDKSQSADEREDFERRVMLMRRIILTVETIVFAAVGYFVGPLVWY
jgi:hypothetical protein